MGRTLLGRLFTRPAPVEVAPPDDAPAEASGRRERAVDRGEDVVLAVIAEKVLHGWLQNRHQTLYPLTINFRTQDDEGRALLASLMAVSVLARGSVAADHAAPARSWLTTMGGDPAMLAAFDTALAAPPALSAVVEGVLNLRLAAYAYVSALVAAGTRDPAAVQFLGYLATRLALPSTVVRSAHRRYQS